MTTIVRYPFLIFALSLVMLWLSTRIDASVRKRRRNLEAGEREDFGVVMAASLTLLGLIIGFSFSLSISRYDQRKNLEAAEANAIGTEFVRADFLPPADACLPCGKTMSISVFCSLKRGMTASFDRSMPILPDCVQFVDRGPSGGSGQADTRHRSSRCGHER